MKNDLYVDDSTVLSVDLEKNILYISTSSDKYDKESFIKFLQYLNGFWELAKNSGDKYSILLDLRNSGADIMPLDFYTTLLQNVNKLGDTFKNNLYSICILINKDSIISNIIKMALMMWNCPRPMTTLHEEDKVDLFFNKHKK
jgi:hypothetical protein